MQRAMAFAQVELPRQEQQRREASVMEGLGAFRRVLQVRPWYKSLHALRLLALLHWRMSGPAKCMHVMSCRAIK